MRMKNLLTLGDKPQGTFKNTSCGSPEILKTILKFFTLL